MKMKLSDLLSDFLKRHRSVTNTMPVEEEPSVGFFWPRASFRGANPQDEGRVVFVDKSRGIRRTVVDHTGYICDFPGIEEQERIKPHIKPSRMEPIVRFGADFEKHEDGYIMIWTVQPDGRYWEDEDGFGAEPDEEIRLYAFMNKDGCFISPFRPYNIGVKRLFEMS